MSTKIRTRPKLTQRVKDALNTRPTRKRAPVRGSGKAPTFHQGGWQGTSRHTCGLWPFVNGTDTPITGAQLGVRFQTLEPVGFDPLAWFDANMLTTPSAFVFSNPAVGKSTLIRKVVTGTVASGTAVQVLGDRKNEHTDLIRRLGGQIIHLGPGRGVINILDPGGALEAADRILTECADEDRGRREARALIADVSAQRLHMLSGLIGILRRSQVTSHEDSILGSVLRWLQENRDSVPVLDDVLTVLRQAPDTVREAVNDHGNMEEYWANVKALENDLVSLTRPGGLGQMFNGHTTEEVLLDRSVCFDISSIDESDKETLSAAYVACWSAGFGATRVARALTDAGLEPNRRYLVVLDEFWQPLAASPGMVDRVNAITRLNRDKGVGVIFASHTMSDLEALSDPGDRAKARDIVARCSAIIIGGLPRKELEERLRDVAGLSPAEIELLVSWNAPPSRSDNGRRQDMVGRGNFIIKRGQKPGLPISVLLTQREKDLGIHDTNKKIRKAGTNA